MNIINSIQEDGSRHNLLEQQYNRLLEKGQPGYGTETLSCAEEHLEIKFEFSSE